MDFNQWKQRYTSIWWYRMIGLDQNKFLNLPKRHWLENDINGIVSNFALVNVFIAKYAYLQCIIFRIIILIAKKDIKHSKTACRKKDLCPSKILEQDQGKKIKNFRSRKKCGLKDWYKFGVQFLVRS